MPIDLRWFEIRDIIYRPDLQNWSQKKFLIVTNSTICSFKKKKKTILNCLKYKLKPKLPGVSKICYIIQRLSSYSLLIDKNWLKKVTWSIYRADDKSIARLELNFLQIKKLKAAKYRSCLSFKHVRKNKGIYRIES